MYRRIISVLTYKNGCLVRTKQFIPDYQYTTNFVDLWSIDEIILLNISQTIKNSLAKFISAVERITENCFVPITMGGGVNNNEDAATLFKHGADKIVINTALVENPALIKSLVDIYGAQSIVGSVDFKKNTENICKAYIRNGTIETIYSPYDLALRAEKCGVGEIMLNSISKDGSLIGYDTEVISPIIKELGIPVIISGGAGSWRHFEEGLMLCGASGVCTSNIYHFTDTSIKSAKHYLTGKNIPIRQ